MVTIKILTICQSHAYSLRKNKPLNIQIHSWIQCFQRIQTKALQHKFIKKISNADTVKKKTDVPIKLRNMKNAKSSWQIWAGMTIGKLKIQTKSSSKKNSSSISSELGVDFINSSSSNQIYLKAAITSHPKCEMSGSRNSWYKSSSYAASSQMMSLVWQFCFRPKPQTEAW